MKNEKTWKNLSVTFSRRTWKVFLYERSVNFVSPKQYRIMLFSKTSLLLFFVSYHAYLDWHQQLLSRQHLVGWPEFIMLSPAAQYQRIQQSYLQRPTNLPERFQYLQQYKPNSLLRAPNMGHELLTKLEQAGKVPSREKFRRMCCQVVILWNKFLSTIANEVFALFFLWIDISINRGLSL